MSLSSLRSLALSALIGLCTTVGLSPAFAQNTMVRVHTTHGPIDIKLLDAEAPLSVTNFLAYARAGDYSNVMFHRSARTTLNGASVPFVIQSGGFRWLEGASIPVAVTSRGTVRNEFSATRSNVRGTVAMAKVSGVADAPNSATSQWFINLGDNAANLDNQNGGFTVFARVTTPGMVVADRIAALPRVNAGSPFNEMPVDNYVSGLPTRSQSVLINQITVFPSVTNQSVTDRILNYLEATYPQHLSPSNGVAGEAEGYTYRFYSGSNAYVGTKDGKVWYLVPSIGPNVTELAPMTDLLGQAEAAGY